MPENQKAFPYEDIVNLPRPAVSRRVQLRQEDRAAQFAPFAALSGHGELMDETARRTDEKIELAPDALAELDAALQHLQAIQARHPEVTITYFQPDDTKAGGAYLTTTQRLLGLDARKQKLLLENGKSLSFSQIYEIEIEEY